MTDVKSVVTYLKSFNNIERQYHSEVIKVIKIILVMLATNAVSNKLQCVAQILDVPVYNITASLTELVYDAAGPQ